MMRRILIPLVVSMLLLQSIAEAQQYSAKPIYIEDIYLSNSQGQRVYDVAPGDLLYLNIVVVRETPGDSSQITGAVKIVSPSGYLEPYPSEASFIIPFTSSRQVDVLTLSTRILINNSTRIGTYISLGVELYEYPTNSTTAELVDYSTYTVYVSGKPSITFSALQSEVEPGLQRVDLIVNNGGALAATNMQISVEPLQPNVYVYNSSITISSIGAGGSVDVPVYLYIPQSMQNSVIQLQIQSSFTSSMGTPYEESAQIPLMVIAPSRQIIDVSATPSVLTANSLNNLTLTISNLGPYNIQSLNISLSSQQLSFANGSSLTLGPIEVNSTVTLPLLVYAPYANTVAQAQITVTATYMDEYLRTGSAQFVLQFYVVPQQVNRVSIYVNNSYIASPGMSTVCIYARSITPIKNLTLYISPPQGVQINTTVLSLGDLDQNSVKESCIAVYTYTPISGTAALAVTSVYSDDYGFTYQEESDIMLHLYAAKPSVVPSIEGSNTVYSGAPAEIDVRFSNNGPLDIYNMSVSISAQSGNVIKIEPQTFTIPLLKANSSALIDISLLSAPTTSQSIVPIALQMSYYDPYGNYYTSTQTLYVEVLPSSATYPTVNINAGTLTVGSNNTISVSIVNSGNSSLLDAYLVLSVSPSSSVLIVNGSPIRIGNIGPGSVVSIPVTIYVLPDVSVSAVTISATLTYIDSQLNAQSSVSTQIPATIQVVPSIIVVDQSVIPQTVSVGGMFTVTLTIMNIGPGTANELYIYPNTSMLPIRAVSQPTVYIGDLSEGRSASASFTLMLLNVTSFNTTFTRPFGGTSTPRYPFTATTTEFPRRGNATSSIAGFGGFIRIPVAVEFSDNLRNTHRVVTYVEVQVSQQSSTQTSTQTQSNLSSAGGGELLAAVVVVVVVGAAVALIALRRRRR